MTWCSATLAVTKGTDWPCIGYWQSCSMAIVVWRTRDAARDLEKRSSVTMFSGQSLTVPGGNYSFLSNLDGFELMHSSIDNHPLEASLEGTYTMTAQTTSSREDCCVGPTDP